MIRSLTLLAAAAALSAGPGCSRPTRAELGARDGVLHLGNGAEPRDLDPQTLETSNEYTISTALFEGLVNISSDGRTILPGVAERWEVAPDGLLWRFHLRAGARWSDGSDLTADDFVYAFRRAFSPALACEGAPYGFAIRGARDLAQGKGSPQAPLGVTAPDERTVEIRLEYPAPYLGYVLSGSPFAPVPRAVVERFGGGTRRGTAWTRPGNLVGNGPFVLKSWNPGADLVVVKNPWYWDRGRVRLREVRFYPFDNAGAEERAFRAGQLHATYTLPPSKIAAYAGAPAGLLHVTPQLNTVYLVFNTGKAPFDNPDVRRAVSLSIDRDRLVPGVLRERGAPAHALTRPGTGGYEPPRGPDWDPRLARELLARAGYPAGAGFPNAEFRVPADFPAEFAQALQEAWRRELGIALEISAGEKKAVFSDLASGSFQVAAMPFFYAVNAPEMILLVPLSDSPYNFSRWKCPAYDQAYRRATAAPTASARAAAFDEMEGILAAQAPFAPLYYVNQCFAVRAEVRGWRDNPLGQIDWRDLSLEGAP